MHAEARYRDSGQQHRREEVRCGVQAGTNYWGEVWLSGSEPETRLFRLFFVSLSLSVVSLFIDLQINLLAPELFFLILAHPVYKMWTIQEPNKLALWNKLHFEEKKAESIEHV